MGPLHFLQARLETARGTLHDLCGVSGLEATLHTLASWRGIGGTAATAERVPLYPNIGRSHTIASDASGGEGGVGAFGVLCGDIALWGRFDASFARHAASATLELYAILAGVVQFAGEHHQYYSITDSAAAAYAINRGRTGANNASQRALLRALFEHAADRRAEVAAVHQPRQLLAACDALSNAHTLDEARALLTTHYAARSLGAPPRVIHAPAFRVSPEGDVEVDHRCNADRPACMACGGVAHALYLCGGADARARREGQADAAAADGE
jgi:hypothetical protein